ncbi:MAG: class II aldolase, partial [Candidatus Thorarchaeota archaeon]
MSNRSQEERLDSLRTEVLETAQMMAKLGLVRASSGNVSARFGKGFLITASGIPYNELESNQIIEVNP